MFKFIMADAEVIVSPKLLTIVEHLRGVDLGDTEESHVQDTQEEGWRG
jgi:hypothetical protein